MAGDSLIRQASRLQQSLTNTLSQIDRTGEMQSFAVPCLTSESKPSDVGVGANSILHLQPERTNGADKTGAEKFEYVSPDTAPLQLAWDTFFKIQAMAFASMSLPGDVLEDKHSSKAPESGVAKAYRYKNTDKRLLAMSLNEQEALREVMALMGGWMGREFDGAISYPTTFDLGSLEDSISNLLSLQVVGMPPTAMKELKRAAISKALPRLDTDTMDQIDQELMDAMTVADRVSTMTQQGPSVDPTEQPDNVDLTKENGPQMG